ncbi:u3 small nucleolar RNA-associated protein 11 [Suillus occidentalis]|nr:u3 small nucleolar RNA-associated protein 11 [Suillus occidentalis]
MTSSLRNSLHRRNHKERSQLSHRAKFGILEKHKDYVKRAQDYHSKQDRITRLRQKAADRNKDEFYFGMNKERTVQGVHLLKTQDEGYVRTMRANGIKKIERIKSQLTALANLIAPQDDNDALDETDLETLREAGVIPPETKRRRLPRHIIFAENETEGESKQLSQQRSSNKVKTSEVDIEQAEVNLGWKPVESASSRRRRKNKTSAGASTDVVEDAEETRQLNVRELEMQRLLAGKGGRRKLRGVEEVGAENNDEDEDNMVDAAPSKASKADEKTYKPRVYKWRIERKR